MIVNNENSICAFSQKAKKFSKMMTEIGKHEVFFYGHEDSDVICTHLVPVTFNKDFISIYKKIPDFKDPAYVAGNNDAISNLYNYRTVAKISELFKSEDIIFEESLKKAKHPIEEEIIKNNIKIDNGESIEELKNANNILMETLKKMEENMKKSKVVQDFLVSMWGLPNEYKLLGHRLILTEQVGSNYTHCPYAAYESYAVLHTNYGIMGNCRPKAYDFVVPNYFDPLDFEQDFSDKSNSYFVFVGRISECKGVEVIIEMAKHLPNEKFKLAGPGSLKECGFKNIPSNIEEVGTVNIEQRKILLKNAKAFILPTLYAEPFGGAEKEATMSGVPSITSNWAVFAETVLHGITGYRANTIDQFVRAAKNIHKIDRKKCYEWAMNNYTLEAVYPRFEEWFYQLKVLFNGGGFYSVDETRTSMDYLNVYYPK